MMCITKAPASRINQLCTVPYGAAWGVYQPSDTAIAALYSHSVTKASSLCQATSVIYYYYTLLEPYVGWANKVGGKDFSVYWEDSSYDYSGSPSFSMKNVGGTSLSGSQILTGDFFKMQRNYVATSGANEDTALATKTDSPESSGNGDSKTSTIKANSNVDADANTDGDGNVSTSAFDEGDYIVMSGSTIAVTDLMTGTDQQNLELTRVYFLTETDDNGNVIVQTDVEHVRCLRKP
ncbi:hypothetical protein GGI07_003276 [Coemansia sp. Benny D115]|nr:hypothetical protein GGI07_003276 [Coemansia sp. Benny D115]